jgi:hypothetical protein
VSLKFDDGHHRISPTGSPAIGARRHRWIAMLNFNSPR